MSNSLLALVGYAAWMLILLGILATLRSALTLSGKREASTFSPDGRDVSPFSARLCRAHANCYESLPIFAAVVVAAVVSGNAAVTDPLALWVLAARIGQSSVHLASVSNEAVTVRFGLFLVQYVILAWWIVQLLS
jgi:uncharacterized MAPEG superfamily protein